MKLRQVKNVQEYLKRNKLSPEKFATTCGISNMTIRRWMKQPLDTPLPKKYWPLLDQTLNEGGSVPFVGINEFPDLEAHLLSLGKEDADSSTLESRLQTKELEASVPRGLIMKAKTLIKLLTTREITTPEKALAVGAIVYLINPFDLIPDTTPMLGYVDDLAALTLVLTTLTKALASRDFSLKIEDEALPSRS